MGCERQEEKNATSTKKQTPVVEILYMNHGPVQPVLKKMRSEFVQFENKAEFKWYDFEKDIEFKNKKGIDSHIPLIIWINNSNIAEIDGTKIKFAGFPNNDGPKFARGKWEIPQLIEAIRRTIKGN
jgi:hypothetical protein